MTLLDSARLLVILAGAFMVALDFFIVLVALPSIASETAATPGQLQLIVAGYGIANAAGLIAGGKLGDLFGRRQMFLGGMALFGATSVACGLATSGLMLVLMRFAQGASGALLHPQVLALLGLNFPGAKRARAFAAYAMAMGLAGVMGQVLGGALIEIDFAGTGWRSCFFINAPIALVAIVLATQLLERDPPSTQGRRIDVWGMVLTAASLTCLIVPLTYGREALSGLWNIGLLVASAVLFVAFMLSQRSRSMAKLSVMIPPELVSVRLFRLGVGTVLVFYAGIASFYFVLGLHLQATLGASPLGSGLVFAVLGAAFFAASMGGAAIGRTLKRPLVEMGALVLISGHVAQALVASRGLGIAAMLVPLLIEGAGIGLIMAPLVSLALSRTPPQHAGVAAGILSTMQSTGNALGVAAVGLSYIAGLWLPADVHSAHARFAGALGFLAVLALAVWYLARRIRVEAAPAA
ncbi:MAG TPA: MFS transporter [Burkholderiaceae bacterium]|nr:MFS transporter [Burkholderiaceae bacterium]